MKGVKNRGRDIHDLTLIMMAGKIPLETFEANQDGAFERRQGHHNINMGSLSSAKATPEEISFAIPDRLRHPNSFSYTEQYCLVDGA